MNTTIETYNGGHFNVLSSNQFNLEDIGWSLYNICRFNGHCRRRYSVLEHSVNCYLESVARGYNLDDQRYCWTHDWAEAYLGDVTSPLKQLLSDYKLIEDKFNHRILSHYSILGNHFRMKEVDRSVGYREGQQLLKSKAAHWQGYENPIGKWKIPKREPSRRKLLRKFTKINKELNLCH